MLLLLVEGVRQHGGDVVVLLPDNGPLTHELQSRGIEFHASPVVKLTRSGIGVAGAVRLARELLDSTADYDRIFRGRRVDLVHSNTIAVLGGALWASRRRIPHLWHLHEIVEYPWLASRALPRLVSALSDHAVCNSEATFRWMARMQPHMAGTRMSTIRNGLPAPALCADVTAPELWRRFRPEGVRLALGLVGRINRRKGHELLMDAVERLHAEGVEDFSVVFVGDAPRGQEHWEAALRKRVARSPLAERVVFHGFDKDVWSVFAALDIACVPSIESESFGLVALEAMAMGRPVVASRMGGLTEVVSDGVTGLTFAPGSPESLAEALAQLMENVEFRERMGRAGKARYDSEFAASTMIERFVAKYCETIGRN